MSPKQGRPYEKAGKKGRIEIRTSIAEENMLDFCAEKTGQTRTEIIRQGIAEMYRQLQEFYGYENDEEVLKLKVSITCPHCDCNNRIDVYEYEIGSYGYDRGEDRMGDEIEHEIECEDFECEACGKSFAFSGQVWEYPEGCVNHKEIKTK